MVPVVPGRQNLLLVAPGRLTQRRALSATKLADRDVDRISDQEQTDTASFRVRCNPRVGDERSLALCHARGQVEVLDSLALEVEPEQRQGHRRLIGDRERGRCIRID